MGISGKYLRYFKFIDTLSFFPQKKLTETKLNFLQRFMIWELNVGISFLCLDVTQLYYTSHNFIMLSYGCFHISIAKQNPGLQTPLFLAVY